MAQQGQIWNHSGGGDEGRRPRKVTGEELFKKITLEETQKDAKFHTIEELKRIRIEKEQRMKSGAAPAAVAPAPSENLAPPTRAPFKPNQRGTCAQVPNKRRRRRNCPNRNWQFQ